ncbi:MAG: DUF2207 domain-containing protein [Acidobacteriota bacterium]|nr:DUF2207 domain-containing protein [Acidobacteriota bacterium]
MNPRFIVAKAIALCILALPAGALAQRALHWDHVEVTAHLDAEGRLLVTETQTMVFSGDWNGGERRFNIRPRQQLRLVSVDRAEGDRSIPMVRDSSLGDVDDYAFTDDKTLRWRSRLPDDAPFADASRTYVLRYQLANIVLKNGDDYTLDHDFLFPDRQGVITRASVALTLDPAWQPQTEVRSRYTAEQVPPGRGLVVTIPLRYTGAGVRVALATNLPPGIVRALWSLLLIPIVVVGWVLARERWYGWFAPLHAHVDEAWIREHIVKHPAEVVAAAWDTKIESAEVVALIARLVAEGKLTSGTKKKSMTLHLAADRDTLDGYERALVDGLFFQTRTDTSTEIVQRHYKKTGFDPVGLIRPGLQERAAAILPPGRKPWSVPFVTTALYCAGAVLIGREWMSGYISTTVAALLAFGALTFVLVARAQGLRFRANIQWGPNKAFVSLIPVALGMGAAALYLWRWADSGVEPASDGLVLGVVLLALSVLFAGVGTLKSTQHRAALAFRKTLASGREFFIAELAKDRPALRDEWFPWILAFGLGKQMDEWSAQRESGPAKGSTSGSTSSGSFGSGEGSGSGTWTGFAGGRSGGGGGGASWSTAAAGLVAPIAAESSSSSGGGSSGSSSSSSGGSSGGGGGGGW